jgi:hypothetical protein
MPNENELKKKVDESWKEAISKEKESADHPAHEIPELPEVTFQFFITGLMMEALVALGDVEHPVSKAKTFNSTHTKFIIDTLAMLQVKTANNLQKEESEMLDSIIYDLRMRFISKLDQGKVQK